MIPRWFVTLVLVAISVAAAAGIIGALKLLFGVGGTVTVTPQPYKPIRFTETEQRYLADLSGVAAGLLLKEQLLPESERGLDARGMQELDDACQWAWESSMDLVPVESHK